MKLRRAFSWLILIPVAVAVFGLFDIADGQQVVPPYRYGEQPVVEIPNIDALVEAEAGLVHYWTFGDSPGGTTPGPCATQVADSVALDANASVTPSPVPLNCSTPTASPYPYQGATGLVQDGSTMVELTNQVLGLQGQWFTPASAGLLSSLCNANAGGSCNHPFTVACIVEAGNLANASYFFSDDGTTTGLAFGASMANGLIVLDRGTAIQTFAPLAAGHPYFVTYTFDGTSLSSVYLNGVLALATTSPLPQASANSVTYFGSETGAAGGWNGRMGKCQLQNVAITAADVRAQYLASGFW